MAARSRQSRRQRFFLNLWYSRSCWWCLLSLLLLPLSALFRLMALLRKRAHIKQQSALPVPVIVIGNISVGGTGKTPIVIALAKVLQDKGIRVGVVSRGYGGQASHYPMVVQPDSPVELTGDESLLIAQSTACPVVVDPNRLAAADYLIQHHNVQIILSDDGLQHYRLPRSMEIVVIDGARSLGNQHCLPAGPLREPIDRLKTVDWVLINGQLADKALENNLLDAEKPSAIATVTLEPMHWINLHSKQVLPLQPLPWAATQEMLAIAAIGNPQRFFTTLRELGIETKQRAFDDHHAFTPEDFANTEEQVIIMTRKDAVKCLPFIEKEAQGNNRWWALDVAIDLPQALIDDVVSCVGKV